MSLKAFLNGVVCVLAIAGLGALGCSSQPAGEGEVSSADAARGGERADHDEHSEHVHGEWWCAEHGVPEEVCAQCDTKLAADFQKKGDWCEKHNRPDSQCFICHPELAAKFAAQYEAKYGEQPPKPTE